MFNSKGGGIAANLDDRLISPVAHCWARGRAEGKAPRALPRRFHAPFFLGPISSKRNGRKTFNKKNANETNKEVNHQALETVSGNIKKWWSFQKFLSETAFARKNSNIASGFPKADQRAILSTLWAKETLKQGLNHFIRNPGGQNAHDKT